jgi:hypothetical protein
MEGLIVFGVIAAALALFDILALRYGADSRIELGDAGPARGISV